MKAIGLDTYGGPDVLHSIDLPEPHPSPGEVRIRVHVAAVAPVDAMLRTGLLDGLYEGLEPPFVPGMEIAGVVDELGPDIDAVLEIPVGTEVVGFVDVLGTHGAYSDTVVLPAASVARAPKGATAAETATFLNNGLSVRNAFEELALPAGSTLLVTGAAGSVGGSLTQLGSHEGLHVIAIASPHDEELVRSFGADTFVPRGEGAAQKVRELLPDGVDAVADAAVLGDRLTAAIRDGGKLAMFRSYDDDPGRGITVHRLNVRQRATDHDAITRLREQVEEASCPCVPVAFSPQSKRPKRIASRTPGASAAASSSNSPSAEAHWKERSTMSKWTAEDIDRIAATDDLHVAPFRADGVTYGTPTWIWSVVVDGRLFVRAWNGVRSRWYRAAIGQRAGRITAAGGTFDVAFAEADPVLNGGIDSAYREKYAGSPYLPPMIAAGPSAATVEIIPASSVARAQITES